MSYLQNLNVNALYDMEGEGSSRHDSASLQSLKSEVCPDPGPPSDASSDTIIVFGGYSYGSMICLNLPSVTEIALHFVNPPPGSSQSEILLRAIHLAKQRTQDLVQIQSDQKAASQDISHDSSHSTRIGGDESEHDHFKSPKHFRHSLGTVKKSLDLPKGRREAESRDTKYSSALTMAPSSRTEPQYSIPCNLRCGYLLISPLLPPISTFATMFTKLTAPRAGDNLIACQHSASHDPAASDSAKRLTEKRWTENPTMAIYGDRDAFTSQKKLRRWAESLKQVSGSCFDFHEIAGAGHFWHEEGVEMQIKAFTKNWLDRICLPTRL